MKEIERRVALNEEQAQSVVAKLDAMGAQWKHNQRMIIDLSGGLETRERTVMVRVNDGDVEIVVKTGKAQTVTRHEASVQVASGLSDALNTVALLGYAQASCGLRSMQTCKLGNLEYSLRKIIDMNDPSQAHGYNFEVELTREGTIDQIDAKLAELGLEPLGEEETLQWFKRLHKEANVDYELSEESAKELESIAARHAGGAQ